jgi:hypothetical protein
VVVSALNPRVSSWRGCYGRVGKPACRLLLQNGVRQTLAQTIVASHDAFPSADQQRTDHHRIYGTALAAANHRDLAGAQPSFQQPVRSSLPNNQLNSALKFLRVYSANCRSNTQSADCGGWGVSMLTAGFLPWPRHQILVQGAARPRNVVVAAQTACLQRLIPTTPWSHRQIVLRRSQRWLCRCPTRPLLALNFQ